MGLGLCSPANVMKHSQLIAVAFFIIASASGSLAGGELDGTYTLTLAMAANSCNGGLPVGASSTGQLTIVTTTPEGEMSVSFVTPNVAAPNLVGYPATGVLPVLVALTTHEFKFGSPHIILRMSRKASNAYSVQVSWLMMQKHGEGFVLCETRYEGTAIPRPQQPK